MAVNEASVEILYFIFTLSPFSPFGPIGPSCPLSPYEGDAKINTYLQTTDHICTLTTLKSFVISEFQAMREQNPGDA